MGGANRSLEWLTRRRDGESMALIAWRDGVSPETVKRATAPYGPFPAASRHLGRTVTASSALDERTQRWVDARRRGEPVSDISRRDGVAHQLVSRYTAEAGPFPADEVVHEWVQARLAGQTIAAIAITYAAPQGLVSRATRPWGPFRPPGSRLPVGLVGGKGIARMAGVSDATGLRWVRTGRVPDPDFVVGKGRALWLTTTVVRWLKEADLATCTDCGARCVSLNQHRSAARHGQAGSER
jgi:hypothetical protein